ncbi:OxaA precursor, partial [Enterococcus faecalis]|nr:OxaA precursor [Enterococcus faecalis]
ALYWVVGGIFTCIQSAITNILLRPRIKKQVQEELKNNPPKQVVTPIKDVTPKETNKATQKTNQPKANGNKGRNAGKQKRK